MGPSLEAFGGSRSLNQVREDLGQRVRTQARHAPFFASKMDAIAVSGGADEVSILWRPD